MRNVCKTTIIISWVGEKFLLQKLKLYTVTKGNTDGSIEKGDIVWISQNGDLNSFYGKGFFTREEWLNDAKMNNFCVEDCTTHILKVSCGHELVEKI